MQILVNFVNFVTTSNTLNYHFNVVFLFHCFVVITVVCKKDSFELILNNNFISLIFPLKSQILEICKWHIKMLKSSNFHTILNKLDCWDLIQSIGILNFFGREGKVKKQNSFFPCQLFKTLLVILIDFILNKQVNFMIFKCWNFLNFWKWQFLN